MFYFSPYLFFLILIFSSFSFLSSACNTFNNENDCLENCDCNWHDNHCSRTCPPNTICARNADCQYDTIFIYVITGLLFLIGLCVCCILTILTCWRICKRYKVKYHEIDYAEQKRKKFEKKLQIHLERNEDDEFSYSSLSQELNNEYYDADNSNLFINNI